MLLFQYISQYQLPDVCCSFICWLSRT